MFLTVSNVSVIFKFLSPSEGTSVVNGGFWNPRVVLCFYMNLRQFAENDLTDTLFKKIKICLTDHDVQTLKILFLSIG